MRRSLEERGGILVTVLPCARGRRRGRRAAAEGEEGGDGDAEGDAYGHI
jgi:hypothetical protein